MCFRYHSDAPEALSHLSFDMKSGKFIGITGSSGSGKSTITKLLLRLYNPNLGEVYVDGADPVELHRSMSIVLQDSHLFSATVAENIASVARKLPKNSFYMSQTACSAGNRRGRKLAF